MARDTITLRAPVGGLNKAWSYQSQPPFTTVRCNNVRSFDVIEGRGRIGSRPGLARAFAQQITPGLDVIIDGTFSAADDDTKWVTPAGWAIAGGVATATGAISTDLSQAIGPLIVGATYLVTYSYTRTEGSISAVCGTTAGSVNSAASGSISENIVCTGTTGFKFATVGFTGTVDNVTAKMNGNPIRMAAVIRSLATLLSATFSDEFTGTTMSNDWSHPSWTLEAVASAGLPAVAGGLASTSNGAFSDLRTALLSVQSTAPFTFRELSASWSFSRNDPSFNPPHQKLFLCMDMATGSPNPNTGGVMLSVQAGPPAGTVAPDAWILNLYVHGVLKVTMTQSADPVTTQVVRMSIDTNNVVRVYAKDGTTAAITWTIASYVPSGQRVGFGIQGDTGGQPGGNVKISSIEWLRFAYALSGVVSPPEAVVLSANGAIFREAPAGTLASDTVTNRTLASDRRVYATARLQAIYIADYGIRLESTGATTNAGGQLLSDANITTGLGIDTSNDVMEIISGTGVKVGIYNIGGAANGSIPISPDANTVAGVAASAIRYRILRQPKVFDASVNPPTLTNMGLGTIGVSQFPAGCRSVTLWQDRLWWCNNALTSHGWWASAAGYPTNYDYGDTGTTSPPGTALGVGAAVNGTQAEFAGLIGEPLVTIIPINDDVAVFACKTSFYYMIGNPRLNGSINNISREIGIVDIGAWCRTADGQLIVLTPDGLYDINTQSATPLSRDLLPQELVGLTEDRYDISLAYDVARRGVLISASGKDASITSIHYFYDLRTGAFLPQSFDRTQDPTAVVTYQPSGIGLPSTIWGGRDGYVRRFEDAAQTDDGTNFNSNVFLGPIRLGPTDDLEGVVHEFIGTLDAQSGIVVVNFYVGDTPQAALASSAAFSCSLSAGRNYSEMPKIRGGVVYVELVGTPGSRWVFESGVLMREIVGKLRKS